MKKNIGIVAPIPEDILKLAKKIRRWIMSTHGTSKDKCGIASREIEYYIEGYKTKFINSTFVAGEFFLPHCWVEIEIRDCKYILDITADQFNHHLVIDRMMAIVFGTKSQLKKYYKYPMDWKNI